MLFLSHSTYTTLLSPSANTVWSNIGANQQPTPAVHQTAATRGVARFVSLVVNGTTIRTEESPSEELARPWL